MKRVVTVLLALVVMWALAAVPASADPPERFEDVAVFIGLDLDSRNWVFANINRDAVCGGAAPFVGLASFREITAGDGLVVQISAPEAPTWLHPVVGDPAAPGFNPCDNSVVAPAFSGTVDVRFTANDVGLEGKRAYSEGLRAQGALDEVDADSEPTGRRFHFTWANRIVIPPDEAVPGAFEMFDESWRRADNYTLRPIGATR